MGLPTKIFLVILIIISIPIIIYCAIMIQIAKDIKKGLSRLSGAFKKLGVKLKSLIIGVS
ncbi:MAG: hypothetical protein KJ571_11605 [Bacteroidetes bacterium]|nr:hypothetical protein [Bacteroidota bacterium]